MKRYIVLAAAVIGVAFFVSHKAQAETGQLQNNHTGNETACANGRYGTPDTDCNDTGTWDTVPATFWLAQEVTIPQVSLPTPISDISIYQAGCANNGAAYNQYAYILNADDLAELKAATLDIDLPYQAQSNALSSNCSTGTTTFSFATPYIATTTNSFAAVVFRFLYSAGSSDEPKFYISQFSYPNFSSQTLEYDGYKAAGGGTGLINGATFNPIGSGYDLAITLWNGLYPLTFTHPTNNSRIVNEPTLTITGTCDSQLDVTLYQGTSLASSTRSLGSSRTCSSNAWSWPVVLEGGYWNAIASSTTQTTGIVFYYLAQSIEPNPEFDNNPFEPDEGGDLGFWGYLYDWGVNKGTLRPYSYIAQIGGSMYSAMASPTPSDWISQIHVGGGGVGSTTLPGIDSSIFMNIPTEYKTNFRSVSTLAFAAAFIAYIWHLRHRLHG